jgi:hypothetical protein
MFVPFVRANDVAWLESQVTAAKSQEAREELDSKLRVQVQLNNPEFLSFFEKLDYGKSPMRTLSYALLAAAAGDPLPEISAESYDAVRSLLFSEKHGKYGHNRMIPQDLGLRIKTINPNYALFVATSFYDVGENPGDAEKHADVALRIMNDGVAVHQLFERQYRELDLLRPEQETMPQIQKKHVDALLKLLQRSVPSNPNLAEIAAQLDRPIWCNDLNLVRNCKNTFGDYSVTASYTYFLLHNAAEDRLPQVEQDIIAATLPQYCDARKGFAHADKNLAEIGRSQYWFEEYARDSLDKCRQLKQMMPQSPVNPDVDFCAEVFVYDALHQQIEKNNKKN